MGNSSQARGYRPVKLELETARDALTAAWTSLTETEWPADRLQVLASADRLSDTAAFIAMYVATAIDCIAMAQQLVRQAEGERIIRLPGA